MAPRHFLFIYFFISQQANEVGTWEICRRPTSQPSARQRCGGAGGSAGHGGAPLRGGRPPRSARDTPRWEGEEGSSCRDAFCSISVKEWSTKQKSAGKNVKFYSGCATGIKVRRCVPASLIPMQRKLAACSPAEVNLSGQKAVSLTRGAVPSSSQPLSLGGTWEQLLAPTAAPYPLGPTRYWEVWHCCGSGLLGLKIEFTAAEPGAFCYC